MKYDVIVIGGGIAGLTATAYLSKGNKKVLLCEKESEVGGLVSSFEYKGFTFDGGIRAMENSGIVLPMLRQLGLDIPFVRSIVSVGIENEVITVESKEALEDYRKMLKAIFPDNTKDIDVILKEIKLIMKHMDVLYGIDNPMFMDLKRDKKYIFKTLFPWLFKYLFTVGKIEKLNTPVDEYLNSITDNQSLIDMIGQHFFQKTPTFFALSYFSLYLDYKYPIEGTGMLINKMVEFIQDHLGEIKTNTKIEHVDLEKKTVRDASGNTYEYNKLVWAADLKTLYDLVDFDQITNKQQKEKALKQKERISGKIGGDSVLTVDMTTNMNPQYFKKICTEDFFYTPIKAGLNTLMNSMPCDSDKLIIQNWIDEYYEKTTFEISIPALRNEELAPKGKTGLIVSTLMDYLLVKQIRDKGWYDEFKTLTEKKIVDVLNKSIFKDLKENIIDTFCSTPLTIEKRTGNLDGAITGWAFTNDDIPAVKKMIKIAKSVDTPLPDIVQAGQWSYSPAGLPISILTGKMAADKAMKK